MSDVETVGPRAKARWSRLAALGLLMAGLGPLIMFLAGLLWGLDVSEDAGFFLVVGGLGLIASFLVARFGMWSKFVGILASLVIGMMFFWTAFSLFTPGSFFDFVAAILVVPGVLIGLIASIGAIVAGRRGHVSTTPEGGEARWIRSVMAVVVVLAVASAALTFLGRSEVEGSADQTVVLHDFEFDMASYEFAPGSTVLVRNDDPFLHTFTVEELDIDEAVGPGSEVLVEIPDEPGDYVLFCRPHSDPNEPDPEEDMAAELSVE